jgi:hypothetical protein
MTEATCNAFLAKITDIKTASLDPTTTLTAIQTLIDELGTLDELITTELATVAYPTTVSHLNSFITASIERAIKNKIHASMLSLINTRKVHLNSMRPTATYEELAAYINDTSAIGAYINDVIASCYCMKSLNEICRLTDRF